MLRSIRLSLRNLQRYRTRTAITIMAVLISVLVSTATDGFIRGIFSMSIHNLCAYESAEVSVYSRGYFEKRKEYPNSELIMKEDLEDALQRLEKAGFGATPRYRTGAEIVFYSDEEGVEFDTNAFLIGIDPVRDGSVFRLGECIAEGSWLGKDEGVVVGSGIAEKLGLKVGSFITLSMSGREGFAETIDEEVIGIINTENPVVNSSHILIPLTVLDEYLLLDGAVTEIAVSDRLPSDASPSMKSKAASAIGNPELEAYHYQDVNDDLMAIMNADNGSSIVMLFFLFIIAAAGISNTMIMAAMERQKESAMMRAIGFSNSSIIRLFAYEGLITGFIGAVIGTVLALIVMVPLSSAGIDLSTMIASDMDIGYRVPLILRPGIYWQSFAVIPALAVLLSGLSALLPLAGSGRKEIAELFRSV